MNRLYWTKLVGGAPCPCWTDHGGRLLCTPISVTLVHEEHLTDDAPYGYISNTAQEPHLTCPTSWASKTKLTVEQHEHWTHLAPFKYLSRRRQVPQTICAISEESGGGGSGSGGVMGSHPGGGPSSSSLSISWTSILSICRLRIDHVFYVWEQTANHNGVPR